MTFRDLPWLANPTGDELSGLLQKIMKGKGLWEALVPNGYIQFGKGSDIDYDPVASISARERIAIVES